MDLEEGQRSIGPLVVKTRGTRQLMKIQVGRLASLEAIICLRLRLTRDFRRKHGHE